MSKLIGIYVVKMRSYRFDFRQLQSAQTIVKEECIQTWW